MIFSKTCQHLVWFYCWASNATSCYPELLYFGYTIVFIRSVSHTWNIVWLRSWITFDTATPCHLLFSADSLAISLQGILGSLVIDMIFFLISSPIDVDNVRKSKETFKLYTVIWKNTVKIRISAPPQIGLPTDSPPTKVSLVRYAHRT